MFNIIDIISPLGVFTYPLKRGSVVVARCRVLARLREAVKQIENGN